MSEKMTMLGDKQLIKALDAMKVGARNRILRPAVREATKPIRTDMKRLAPRRYGTLKKSIATKMKTYKSVVVSVTGPRSDMRDPRTGEKPSKYAHLVEFSTKPHTIRPSGGKALAWAVRGNTRRASSSINRVFARAVNHPGTAAQPFLRPAFDRNKTAAMKIMRDRCWAEIRKQAAKTRRRAA